MALEGIQRERKSNMEALRIVAMLMITAYHYVIHGSFDALMNSGGGINRIFLDVFSLGGKAGVNLFSLLMGYFGIKAIYQMKKALQVEAQVLFYSILCMAICLGFGLSEFSVKAVVKGLLPLTFNEYWFMTAYIIVYLLSPYLNKLFLDLKRQEQERLLALCFWIWCVIPFFTLQTMDGMFLNQMIWFIVMYMLGAYLRLHAARFSAGIYKAALILSTGALVVLTVGLNIIGQSIPILLHYTTYFRWSNSPFIVIACIALFRLFENWRIGVTGWINWISTSTLGVYLFQENQFVRPLLWGNILTNASFYGSWILIIHAVISVILVFASGILIDHLRIKLIYLTKKMKYCRFFK